MDCASDGVICIKAMARHTKMSFSFTVWSYQVVLADAGQSQWASFGRPSPLVSSSMTEPEPYSYLRQRQ
jgi:hypothetical protein